MKDADWLTQLGDEELLTATISLTDRLPDTAAIRDRVARAASILQTLKKIPQEPSLICIGTTLEPRVQAIGQGVTVGRHAECSFAVPESTAMSRQHFRLRLVENAVVLEDLESRNGTFINDPDNKLTKPRVLLDGDLILAGEMAFLFVNAGDD
jgi:pSer/pThr/pTyr-binding forkhead associated (FHA) protein